jgi:glycyl-tRNA synthetase beta chain
LSARDVQSIAIAIEDHYRPLGPNDRVPTDKVAITLALADKLDTLVGFWAIDEKPTGSRDPYALRRAALGVVRAALEGKVRFSIKQLIDAAFRNLVFQYVPEAWPYQPAAGQHRGQQEYVYVPVQPANAFTKYSDRIEAAEDLDPIAHIFVHEVGALSNHRPRTVYGDFVMMGAKLVAICLADTTRDVSAFLADRLKVQLRDQGKRHDLVDAVFALGDDDLVRIVARVEALDKFLKTDDGANVLAGYKRAANILAAEEKKGKGLSEAELTKGYDAAVLGQNPQVAEQALLAALTKIGPLARDAVEKEQFETAMTALAGLRAPLDLFFEQVLVNDKDEQVRRNRLLLLTQIRDALGAVADFSKIEG